MTTLRDLAFPIALLIGVVAGVVIILACLLPA